MLFSLLYFLIRRLLGTGGRLHEEKDIELLVVGVRNPVSIMRRPRGTRG
jgi:hypothetical protein